MSGSIARPDYGRDIASLARRLDILERRTTPAIPAAAAGHTHDGAAGSLATILDGAADTGGTPTTSPTGYFALALGSASIATGENSVAAGPASEATGYQTAAFGRAARASGYKAVALGTDADATDDYRVAVGASYHTVAIVGRLVIASQDDGSLWYLNVGSDGTLTTAAV